MVNKGRRFAIVLAIALVVSAAVTVPVGFLLIRSENQRVAENRKIVALDRLEVVRSKLESAVHSRLFLTSVLAAYVSNHPDLDSTDFALFAKTIVDSQPGIRSVQLARNNVVTHIYPLEGNQGVLGLRLLEDLPPDQVAALRQVINSHKTVVAGPVRLLQGGMGIISRTPIFFHAGGGELEDLEYWGLVTMVVDTDYLFHEAGIQDATDLPMAVRGKDGLGEWGDVIWGDPAVFNGASVKLDISMPGGSWQLAAALPDGADASNWVTWSLVGAVWLLLGAGVAGLLLWPLNLQDAVREATGKLQEANSGLEQKVAGRTEELWNANTLLEQEIEDRKFAEVSLRESEDMARKLYQAVEQSPVTVVITDLTGAIEYVNPTFEITTGYTKEESIGQNPRILKSGDMEPEGYRVLWETISSGREWRGEFCNRKKNGELYWEHASISPIRNRWGEITHYLAVKEDITERRRMEHALGESEERFRKMFHKHTAVMMLIDPETGSIVDANLAAERFYCYALDVLKRMTIQQVNMLPAEEVARAMNRVKRENSNYFVFPHLLASGEVRTVEVHSTPIEIQDKVMLFSIIHDITERMQAEEALREREESLRQLYENAPIGIFRSLPNGRYLSVNAYFARMFGFGSPEEMVAGVASIGEQIYDEPEDRVVLMNRLGEEGAVMNFEVRRRTRTGKAAWMSLNVRSVYEEVTGKIRYFEGFAEEITERKRAEEILQESEQRFRTLFENSPLAYHALDQAGCFVDLNDRLCELLGYDLKDLFGKSFADLLLPEARTSFAERFSASIASGAASTDLVLIRKDGMPITALVEGRVQRDALGRFVRMHCILYDITERKRAEDALHESNRRLAQETERANTLAEKARAASSAKTAFLANMSHEIRTPMHAILGFAQLMRQDAGMGEKQQRYVEAINRSGEHLLALINDILEMSKIEAGSVSINMTTFDVRELLGDLELMFRVGADAKGVGFRVELSGPVPWLVHMDQGKVRQIIINLLGNAVKFTHEGEVVLTACMRQRKEGGFGLVVEVKDTGPGIAAEEMEKLFRPFEQTKSGMGAEGSTGLGLAISQRFAHLMGGSITVESAVSEGSLFRFESPAEIVHPVEPPAKENGARLLPVASPVAGRAKPAVLIADDSEVNRLILVKMLETLGCEVREACNGQEAVEVYEEWGPDLVLMDIRMPVMDGLEATRWIRNRPGGRNTPIIAATAGTFDEDRVTALEAGVDGFLGKPFRESDLVEKIGEYVGLRRNFGAHETVRQGALPTSPPLGGDEIEIFSRVPQELLDRLIDVTVKADIDAMMEVIEQIGAYEANAANVLRGCAERYDYQRIMDLIPSGEKL